MNIAITGGLGSGKSTVSKILAAYLDAELIDTDNLCRLQMLPGAQGFTSFLQIFDGKYIQADGAIDRLELRKAVFSDPDIKKTLENILHPIVRSEVATCCQTSVAQGKIVVVEVPLLFEVGWQQDFEHTVAVFVLEKVCIQRVMARDGIDKETILNILSSQMPVDIKRRLADFIIDNSSTFASTIQQIAWFAGKCALSEKS
jgi:dephospho-CoA kinase